MTKETLYFQIQTLTPVHIGTGEVIDFTSFVIDEENQTMFVFPSGEFINFLDNDEINKFNQLCLTGTPESLLKLYNFMSDKVLPKIKNNESLQKLCRKIPISAYFTNEYRKILNKDEKTFKNELRSFDILKTASSVTTNIPYIPGSSIKGSLRTAFLNSLAKNHGDHEKLKKIARSNWLEEELLKGKFATDPFRCVKVTDFHADKNAKTAVYYAINLKKIPEMGDTGNIPVLLEAIVPGTIFTGSITIDVPKGATLKIKIGAKALFEAIHNFYAECLTIEHIHLTKNSIDVSQIPENIKMPFKIGFHSGAEAVTIKPVRKISRGPRARGRTQPSASTFWCASADKKLLDPKPFGWAKFIHIENQNKYNSIQEQIQNYNNELITSRTEIKIECQRDRKILFEKQKLEKAEQMRKEEEDRKKEELQQKMAAELAMKLDSMTQHEKDIYLLDENKISNENEANEIYNRIKNEYKDETQKTVAQALKKYWSNIDKKWFGKLTSKQKDKVFFIKNTLGEPLQTADNISTSNITNSKQSKKKKKKKKRNKKKK